MNDLLKNDLVQSELMVYVERIVRPVRATQARRLRMRGELLAHLQAALAEERGRLPDDELAAVERATQRLGDPRELTKTLQQSVPFGERILMARVDEPASFTRWEYRLVGWVYGIRGVMTQSHTAILAALAGLIAGVPLYMSQNVRDVLTRSGQPVAHLIAFFLGILAGLSLLVFLSEHFVFTAAAPGDRAHWGRIWAWGTATLVLQVALFYFTSFAATNRPAEVSAAAACALATIALLTISAIAARYIAVRRRPYDPWLSLKLVD